MKNKKLFSRSSGSIADVCLAGHHLQDPGGGLCLLGWAYYEASEAYFKKIRTESKARKRYAEENIFPALFLFRHSIELFLKATILYSSRIKKSFSSFQTNELKLIHSLSRLYDMAKKNLPSSEQPILSEKAEKVLQELKEVDNDGDAFRYPFNKNYQPFWDHTLEGSSADLWKKLKPLGQQLGNRLEGLVYWADQNSIYARDR